MAARASSVIPRHHLRPRDCNFLHLGQIDGKEAFSGSLSDELEVCVRQEGAGGEVEVSEVGVMAGEGGEGMSSEEGEAGCEGGF